MLFPMKNKIRNEMERMEYDASSKHEMVFFPIHMSYCYYYINGRCTHAEQERLQIKLKTKEREWDRASTESERDEKKK